MATGSDHIGIVSRMNYIECWIISTSRFSSNSEAFPSELLENREEMIPRYCIHTFMFSIFKYPTTHRCAIRRERVS